VHWRTDVLVVLAGGAFGALHGHHAAYEMDLAEEYTEPGSDMVLVYTVGDGLIGLHLAIGVVLLLEAVVAWVSIVRSRRNGDVTYSALAGLLLALSITGILGIALWVRP